jgi:exonuclease III
MLVKRVTSTMELQPNNYRYSAGCPCVPEDGSAVQAERTLSCPEAQSRNYVKPPGGGLTQGLNPLIPHEPLKNDPDQGFFKPSAELRLEDLELQREEVWKTLGRKQGVRIASLNVKGRAYSNRKDKWKDLATIIRKNNILVLAIQESHLNEEEADLLREKYPKLIFEINGEETNKEGVAFVLNKDLMQGKTWIHTHVIPNRASRLQVDCGQELGLDLVNVYVPNDTNEKIEFLTRLKGQMEWSEGMDSPILLGDFNFVEQELDRFPRRHDPNRVTDEFSKIKNRWNLVDGWRACNPDTRDFTFEGTNKAMARIDKIYVNEKTYPHAYNWNIVNPGNVSDHHIVSVDILRKNLPYIGDGMWRMDQNLLTDNVFMKTTGKILKKTEEVMAKLQGSEKRMQTVWLETKSKITKVAKSRQKEIRAQKSAEKTKLKRQLDRKLAEIGKKDLDTEESLIEIREIKTKIRDCTDKETQGIQLRAKARYKHLGERCTKYWFGLKKERLPDTMIPALRNKNKKPTQKTHEMIEIAVEHHATLQAKPEMTQERKEAIQKIEEDITNCLSQDEKAMLEEFTTEKEVAQALRDATNGTTPGKDGIPYEFYKAWTQRKNLRPKDKEVPNIVRILGMLYRNIEEKGMVHENEPNPTNAKFTDSVMMLVYKKKDKLDIANYRPITLLNTDYKIYTKTIATKLGKVAQTRIHPDQGGFVPGRSIFDHTNTTHLTVEYCELVGENGCIVALDQEKAYDKIDHSYLWKVLETFGFPQTFIKRVQQLYKGTEKQILLNGVLSMNFKVERGVHQGDPMSCILYNFAIEPLAQRIRNSKLQGIKIPGKEQRLIVNLFADDTLVYLHHQDKLEDLGKIIDVFCKASTARFNQQKTEYLPVGEKIYRDKVIRERKVGGKRIEDTAGLIRDGQAMRTLGAWVGNEVDPAAQWDNVLESQRKVLKAWRSARLSFRGKELVLKALVQSKAMFLATVNGMPKDVEEKMVKMFKDFV